MRTNVQDGMYMTVFFSCEKSSFRLLYLYMQEKRLKKASGEYQSFDRNKFEQSLIDSGAPESFVLNLSKQAQKMDQKLKTTETLYNFARKELAQKNKKAAMRYGLKRAMFDLGPSGHPFEQFVARLLQAQGYKVQTNLFVRGYCVSHEVDILARKNGTLSLFECKFHNHKGTRSNVKTVLYVKARFDDIIKSFQKQTDPKRLAPTQKINEAWLATNTKHTLDAQKYANCVGIKILSWGYPKGNSLEELIEKTKLYPVTVLLNLSRKLKNKLFQNKVVTVQDLMEFSDTRNFTGHERKQLMRLKQEAKLLI